MSDPAVALVCLSGAAQRSMAGHTRCWCGWLSWTECATLSPRGEHCTGTRCWCGWLSWTEGSPVASNGTDHECSTCAYVSITA
jgi:hypothetical protein